MKKFGTFAGVYTPSLLTILGVIMYLRLGKVVGEAGIWITLVIIGISHIISISTGLSISSIATDKRIKTGGIYYILSRSLGLPMGGAIGLTLFFGTALSISLYIVGFVESFFGIQEVQEFLNMTGSTNDVRIVGTVVIILLVILAFVSTSLAIKTQFLILGFIALSLVSIGLGFAFNTGYAPTAPLLYPREGKVDYEVIFGVFFPAVTGFTAGVAMSGDLKDPKKNIPLGTLASIGTGLVVYLFLAIGIGLFVDRPTLLSDYNFLKKVSYVPFLVVAGIMGATLSSALGGILGAPRIMQAMALDKIGWKALGRGYGPSNEPRNALLFTFVIAEIGILIGELDVIAGVVSMFYLASYGFINFAYWLESWASSDFRPSFRISKFVGIIGFLSCLIIMLNLSMVAMFVAILIIAGIYLWLKKKELQLEYGDVWQSVWMTIVKHILHKIDEKNVEERNWQPNILLFSGGNQNRPHLIDFGTFLVGKYGMLSNFELRESQQTKLMFAKHQQSMNNESNSSKGIFTRQHTCTDIYEGIEKIASTYGFSGVEPNTVLMGWARESKSPVRFVKMLNQLFTLDLNVILLDYDKKRGFGNFKLIDIWWRGAGNNGNLALTISKFVMSSPKWNDAIIRLLIVNSEEGEDCEEIRHNAEKIFDNLRIDVEIKIINNQFEQKSFYEIIRIESIDTDLIFLGIPPVIRPGKEAEFIVNTSRLMHEIGTVALIKASSQFKKIQFGADIQLTALNKKIEEDIDEQEIQNDTIYPKNVRIAKNVKQLHANIIKVFNTFTNSSPSYFFDFYKKMTDELSELSNKSYETLIDSFKNNATPSVMTFTRVQKNFIIRARKILDENNKEEIELVKELIKDDYNELTKQIQHHISTLPRTLTDNYTLKDLELLPHDSTRLRWFKRINRLWVKVIGHPVEYKNNYRILIKRTLYKNTNKTTFELYEKWGTESLNLIFEYRDLIKNIRNSLLLLENKAQKNQVSLNIIKEEQLKAQNYFTKISTIFEGYKQVFATIIDSRNSQFISNISYILNIPNSNKHISKLNKGIKQRNQNKKLKNNINSLPHKWVRNIQLLNNSTLIELRFLSFEDQMRKLFVDLSKKISLIFDEKYLDHTHELLKYLIDFKELLENPESPIPNFEPPKQKFHYSKDDFFIFFKEVVDSLSKNIRKNIEKFPESVDVFSSDTLNDYKTKQYNDTEIKTVALSRLLDYIVQEELLMPLQLQLEILPEQMMVHSSKTVDTVRMITFSDEKRTDLDRSVQVQKHYMLEILISSIESITEISERVENLRNQLMLQLQKQVNTTADRLSILSFTRLSSNLSQYVLDYENKQTFSNIKKKYNYSLDIMQNLFSRIWYNKSNAILMAQELESDIKSTGTNRLLQFTEQYTPKPAVLSKIQFFYQQLFLRPNIFYNEFWYGRKKELNESAKFFERLADGHNGALLVLGEALAGKTFFVHYACQKHATASKMFTLQSPDGGSVSLKTFDKYFEITFGTTRDDIRPFKNVPEGSVIFFDDIDSWWERSSNGFVIIDKIIALIEKYSNHYKIIVSCNIFSYHFISKHKGFTNYFLDIIKLSGFNAQELEQIIMLRHNSSGLKFELAKGKTIKYQDSLRSFEYAGLFSKHFNLTRGNVGAALLLWMSCITDVSKSTISIRTPQSVSYSVFDDVTHENYLYLAQLLLHKQLSLRRLQRILREEKGVVVNNIQHLIRTGLITEDAGRIYSINKYIYKIVVNFISEKGLI